MQRTSSIKSCMAEMCGTFNLALRQCLCDVMHCSYEAATVLAFGDDRTPAKLLPDFTLRLRCSRRLEAAAAAR